MLGKTVQEFWARKGLLLAASALTLTTVVGCADRNNNGQPDDAATSGEVSNATDKAGDAAENTADAAGNAAASAANTASSAASQAANTIAKATKNLDDAALITPKVKTALGANPALNGSNINVDTTDKNVTLTGTVKNASQKNVAGAIAKKNAPGYQVVNNLKVAGGASPKMNR